MMHAQAEYAASAVYQEFCQYFAQSFEAQVNGIEYTAETHVEAQRYLNECFLYWAKLGKYHPLAKSTERPSTRLHPFIKATVERVAAREVQRWLAGQAVLPVTQQQLSPAALDRANPGSLDLERNRLLNFDPSAYFHRRVRWQAPAMWNVPVFMHRYGLGYLAPYTERIRVTTDGRINILSSSRLWFSIFGLEFDLSRPQSPLRRANTTRPQEITNPALEQFLEQIG